MLQVNDLVFEHGNLRVIRSIDDAETAPIAHCETPERDLDGGSIEPLPPVDLPLTELIFVFRPEQK